jgi:F0F1-type ATP synthase assembly protein I
MKSKTNPWPAAIALLLGCATAFAQVHRSNVRTSRMPSSSGVPVSMPQTTSEDHVRGDTGHS